MSNVSSANLYKYCDDCVTAGNWASYDFPVTVYHYTNINKVQGYNLIKFIFSVMWHTDGTEILKKKGGGERERERRRGGGRGGAAVYTIRQMSNG